MSKAAIRTACPYCGVGCGVSATRTGERSVLIKGDATHPANAGRLCSKGTHLGETVSLEGRLLYPEVGGERASWDTALSLVARRFSDTIAQHGPDSVAFYVSGQLLTEDYYVANKLMKGFVGSSNIDTNSRLCMASAVAAHVRAFGEDVVPCSYSDLEQAELIVLVGSNTAWCHPVVWQRIEAAREKRGTKLVVIDPRRTETAERADLHLAIRPDGDVALFNAALLDMKARGLLDDAYLAAHVSAPDGFWDQLGAGDDGLDDASRAAFFTLLSQHPKTITLFSQGANQSASGTDKGNAIINLHLGLGRIGQPGMGPFSITGQPNAMGGREVGGLASMLAAHMGFSAEDCAAAQDFWASPTIARAPGLKAVDMFRAVHGGSIKALWIMATNPAVSMPDAGFVRAAMERCDFVVVSDCMAETDTTAFAHVKLPALAWGEKDGTVTNSERVISRQRPIFPPPGEARADWDMVADVGRRMGWAGAFAFPSPAAVFREYAAQTGFRNAGSRVLDLSEWAEISDADYDAWAPWQWGGASPYAHARYSTPDGKARLVPVTPPAQDIDPAFPLRLNTGRTRDHWHTMTRTALSPKLSQHRREPWVEIHPDDAAHLGIANHSIARVSTPAGESLYRVSLSEGQRRGALFVPMHWTDQVSSGGRTGRLPLQVVDPFSGQPAFKNSPATIAPYAADWRGFIVSADKPEIAAECYWTRVRAEHGWLVELVGQGAIDIEALLPKGERIEARDGARGSIRVAVRDEAGRLRAALFLTRSGHLPPREWILAQLGAEEETQQGAELLAGRAAAPAPDAGPVVCVCFDIGAYSITRAIRDQALASVEAVGKALNAGTNCGSCRPAIAKLIEEARAPAL